MNAGRRLGRNRAAATICGFRRIVTARSRRIATAELIWAPLAAIRSRRLSSVINSIKLINSINKLINGNRFGNRRFVSNGIPDGSAGSFRQYPARSRFPDWIPAAGARKWWMPLSDGSGGQPAIGWPRPLESDAGLHVNLNFRWNLFFYFHIFQSCKYVSNLFVQNRLFYPSIEQQQQQQLQQQ